MAGLLEKTGKGRFRITERGKEALSSNPSTINTQFLLQFPEYADARRRGKNDEPTDLPAETTVSESAAPQERIELAFRELNNSLT
jgi:restriction system protein